MKHHEHSNDTSTVPNCVSSNAIPVNPGIKMMYPKAYSLQLMQYPLNETRAPFAEVCTDFPSTSVAMK